MVRTTRNILIALVLTGLSACGSISERDAGAGLYPTGREAEAARAPARSGHGGLPLPGASDIRMPHINIAGYDNSPIMPLPGPPRGDQPADFSNIGYASWSNDEPSYRLFPGDELEVTVPSAPELSKSLVVQPDGRIALPLLRPVMAADRSLPELEAVLTQAYSSQLLRPAVSLSLKSAVPLKVYVGGEVNNPGMYDMNGDGDALRAIIQAGGFKSSGNRADVAIIRRGLDGHPMMRTADLSGGLMGHGQSRPMDLVPLRRFDIVYVPRTRAAEAAQWVQTYFRDLSPIQLGFNYAINGIN